MIQPRVLKGFRDSLPEMMIAKKRIIRTLEKVFEQFGFSPIDTPALEYAEILLGKGSGETDKQIYRFKDHGNRDVALRFDLTVPLARFVSLHYNELIFPFKRYHIAPVWRGENTQKGRYREFYQCDFDILGSASIASDYEILLLIMRGFQSIKCGDFIININHRGLLNGLLFAQGLADKSPAVLHAIDKIYKIGRDEVQKILVEEEGIAFEKVETILKTLRLYENFSKEGIRGEKIFEALQEIKSTLPSEYADYADELIILFSWFKEQDILDNFAFNPAITRGLDYYTGIVFESFIIDRMDFGSVCSGGRYDNLTGLYSKQKVSGIGASFGLDRLLAVLEDKAAVEKKSTVSEVIIFQLDEKFIPHYFNMAIHLQEFGINAEVISQKQKLAAQFKYAERLGVEWVIIAGDNEFAAKAYNLKNVKTGEEEKSIDLDTIIQRIKG